MSDQAPQKERVIVSEETRPVTVLEDGNRVELGEVISRIYEGEHVQRHEFHRGEKVYKLGPTSTRFQFVDHYDVMAPMLDKGFELEDIILSRGGLHLYTIWRNPETNPLIDPITWDLDMWPDGDRGLFEAMIVTSAIRPGKGIRFQRGLYRLICSNGLVSELLGLGDVKMNHATWNSDRLVEELWGSNVIIGDNPAAVRGPMIGTPSGADRFANVLREMREDTTPQERVPLFVQDNLSAFQNVPKWYHSNLVAQFEAMANSRDDLHTIDVANAVTGAINQGRMQKEDRSLAKPLSKSSSMIKSAINLLGGLSL